jgi:protein required for attachment to host cells
MKANTTWILIADGARARIYHYNGPAAGLKPAAGHEYQHDHAATHDLVSDREGRSFRSVGPGRSAIEPHTDPHRDLKTKFAAKLADVLAQAAEAKQFDALVVVAAPAMLGDLRSELSDQVRSKVTKEIAQDLTKLPQADLARRLKDLSVIA